MKNRIIGKLRSRTGASILFALFLFLVCAVLASVALTAATASAGRLSEITKADQRDSAAASAAELVKKTIDGKSVTITKTEITDDGIPRAGYPKYDYTPKDADPDYNPILRDAAEYKMQDVEPPAGYPFAASDDSGELSELNVTLSADFDSDGSFTLSVEKDGYNLTLRFTASAYTTTQVDTKSVMVNHEESYDETVTTTTTNVTWKLTGIETGGGVI